MRLAVLVYLLWAMAPEQPPKTSPPTRDPFCFRPLEEFCARDKCLTYAAEVQRLKESGYVAEIEARKSAGGDCNSEVAVGRCGPLRTTHRSNGLTGETRYFDKGGKLIAVRADTDVFLGKDPCPNWTQYGTAITCRVTNVKRLCKPK
jgi:hypothetical protein